MTVIAATTATAAPPERVRAGIVSRVTADGVDFVIFQVLFALVYLGYGFARFLLTKEPFALPRPPLGVTSALQFLLLTTYLAWGWASTGRTPGKALIGLRVVTAGGQPLSVLRATARAAVCVLIGPILLAWALVSRRNAAIHDLLFGTAVIYDWRPRVPAETPLASG